MKSTPQRQHIAALERFARQQVRSLDACSNQFDARLQEIVTTEYRIQTLRRAFNLPAR